MAWWIWGFLAVLSLGLTFIQPWVGIGLMSLCIMFGADRHIRKWHSRD